MHRSSLPLDPPRRGARRCPARRSGLSTGVGDQALERAGIGRHRHRAPRTTGRRGARRRARRARTRRSGRAARRGTPPRRPSPTRRPRCARPGRRPRTAGTCAPVIAPNGRSSTCSIAPGCWVASPKRPAARSNAAIGSSPMTSGSRPEMSRNGAPPNASANMSAPPMMWFSRSRVVQASHGVGRPRSAVCTPAMAAPRRGTTCWSWAPPSTPSSSSKRSVSVLITPPPASRPCGRPRPGGSRGG